MKLTQIIATATTAAVLGTAGVSIAGATADGGTASKPSATAGDTAAANRSAPKRHHRRQVVRQALEVAAQTIGIDKADLVKELRAGKTVAEVATAHNVDPQTVIDALVRAATEKIEAAKTAGKLTAEKAAKLEERLPDAVSKLVNNKHEGKGNGGGQGGDNKRGVVRKLARDGVKLAADTIRVEPADLVKELRAGKTIAEVATAHNVDPQTVIDALVHAATEKIEAAKTAGELSAEQAAKLEQGAPQRITKFVNEWHPRVRTKGTGAESADGAAA
jgi:uncharacterized protein (DUF433 family)